MAPMTRSRAPGNIPNDLMATYYGQRSTAGLIVTEGTSPSPNGLGYSRIPGIFTSEQVEGWKKTTEAVHTRGGRIFVQLMHTGRISHPANMSEHAVIFAPSAKKALGQIWTDTLGQQDFPVPTAMSPLDIEKTREEYVTAAANGIKANFDGVELHGANGYLLEQFLSPMSNVRVDEYGGSIENRCRFLLEVVDGVVAAIGKERVGIRLSPYGVASDMPLYPEIDATYAYLARQLHTREILYIHVVDHSSMGAPQVPAAIKKTIRTSFQRTIILSGGFSMDSAAAAVRNGQADLIAFGRPFIINPDLVERFTRGWDLAKGLDMATFYSPGEKGYVDYPAHAADVR